MESVQEIHKATPAKTHGKFTRGPEKPTFKTLRFSDWDALKDQLQVSDLAKQCVFSDLSEGAWKGHWILGELCAQLGLDFEASIQPEIGHSTQNYLRYADTVGRLIDNESEGDKNFMLSYAYCKKLLQAISSKGIRNVVVFPPKEGHAWGVENVQFLTLFSQALQSTDCEIVFAIGDSITSMPEEWEAAVQQTNAANKKNANYRLPGILPQTVAVALNSSDVLNLQNGISILPPTFGVDKTVFENEIFETLEDHLQVYLALHGEHACTISFLRAEAGKRFAEGGYEIALRILDYIKSFNISEEERASVVSQMQNIRIALMDFDAAAAGELPTDNLPDEYKASLYQSKAWGLVMTNQPQEAENYFEKARTYLKPETFPRLYLYLLNISALNKLRLGKIETAFAYEKKIEKLLEEQEYRDWHIQYINAINQARLYKKERDLTISEQYYKRAFDINYRIKNESDLLYTNFCFAQLEGLKENEKRAFIYWLRTCVHWLSNETPEALAPRVAQAILRKRLSNRSGHVEDISKALLQQLTEAAKQVGIPLDFENEAVVPFTRVDETIVTKEKAIGGIGIGLFITSEKITTHYSGPNFNELSKLVLQLLRTVLGISEEETIGTIVTDTQFGSELPSNQYELLDVCIRHQVDRIQFGKQTYELNVEDERQLFLKSTVQICPALRYIEPGEQRVTVHYKRYFSPKKLATEANTVLRLLNQASETLSVAQVIERTLNGNEETEAIEVLINMEKDRLITIQYNPKSV